VSAAHVLWGEGGAWTCPAQKVAMQIDHVWNHGFETRVCGRPLTWPWLAVLRAWSINRLRGQGGGYVYAQGTSERGYICT